MHAQDLGDLKPCAYARPATCLRLSEFFLLRSCSALAAVRMHGEEWETMGPNGLVGKTLADGFLSVASYVLLSFH